MVTTPEEQTAKMVASLSEKMGRSLDEWLALTRQSGKVKHGELVTWLKTEYAVSHGYANLIALRAFASDAGSITAGGGDLESAMFSGKEQLRPIYDLLMKRIHAFGDDVQTASKKGYTSLRRAAQFATLHPSTATRFDVGIKLKHVPFGDRLEQAGSWNGMVTHRVRLQSVTEVDADLMGWLRAAYDAAG